MNKMIKYALVTLAIVVLLVIMVKMGLIDINASKKSGGTVMDTLKMMKNN